MTELGKSVTEAPKPQVESVKWVGDGIFLAANWRGQGVAKIRPISRDAISNVAVPLQQNHTTEFCSRFIFLFFFSNIHKDGEYLMGYNGLYNVIHIIEKNRCWCRIPHSCCADPHSMDAMDPTVSVGLVRHCQPCRREPEDVRCTQQCQRWYILNAKFPNGGVLCKDFMKHDSLKETNDLFSWFPSGKLT